MKARQTDSGKTAAELTESQRGRLREKNGDYEQDNGYALASPSVLRGFGSHLSSRPSADHARELKPFYPGNASEALQETNELDDTFNGGEYVLPSYTEELVRGQGGYPDSRRAGNMYYPPEEDYPYMYHHQMPFPKGPGEFPHPGYVYSPEGPYPGDNRRPIRSYRKRVKRKSSFTRIRPQILLFILPVLIIAGLLMMRMLASEVESSSPSSVAVAKPQKTEAHAKKTSDNGKQPHSPSAKASHDEKKKDGGQKSKENTSKDGKDKKKKEKEVTGVEIDRNKWVQRVQTLSDMERAVWDKRVEECSSSKGGKENGERILILLTAASSNHYTSLLALWKSFESKILRKENDKCIIFLAYDIGLADEHFSFLENGFKDMAPEYTMLRSFNFNAYPKHAALKTSSFAWKAFIINEVLIDFPDAMILWSDAGNVITGVHAIKDLKSLVATYGLTGTHLDEKVGSMTAPEIFELAVNADEGRRKSISESPMLSGAIIGLDGHNATVMNNIFQPWLDCAAKDGCYNPPGSNKKNNRQDQSALSVLYYYTDVVPPEAIPRYQKNKEWIRTDHIGAIAIHADINPSEKESMEHLFRTKIMDP